MAWIIDAKESGDGLFCFCQVDSQDIVDVQYRLYSDEKPPGKLIGIIHEDGQEAADEWYDTNKERIINIINE